MPIELERARVVASLRKASLLASGLVGANLDRGADAIEDDNRFGALAHLDYVIARTRSPRVLAAATAALEWLGDPAKRA